MEEVHSMRGDAVREAPWKIWLKTSRPITLTATASPVLVGTAVALYQGTFHLAIFLLTFLSCMCLQIGTNYFNEYFDHRYGLDHAGSLGAMTVIFRNEMTANQVLGGGILSFIIAAVLGIVLIVLLGPVIILFGLAGMLVAYFYSAKPFKFASRGLGDVLVFIAMGFLMTWGSYYVQIQQWSWQAFAACIPVGCLVVSILNMNNVRDYEDDFAVNKKTIPVRFGLRFGQLYHTALLIASYVTTTLFVLFGLLPLAALAVWLTCPLAFRDIALVVRARDRKAFITGVKLTSLLHLVFGLVLAIAIMLARR